MIRAQLHPYCLPLKRPWLAARATLRERRGALLELNDADGRSGWGDCAPLPSGGDPAVVLAALAEVCRRPAGADFSDLPPEVRWAIETAQADLAAQRDGLPLYRHLGGSVDSVAINAALGPLDDGCVARAAAAAAQGFAIGKIKVGVGPVDAELDCLRAVVDATGGRIRLRLDANRAWPEATATRFLTACADLPIDGVEEPLADPTLAALAQLQAKLPFAIAVDESLPQFGVAELIAARAVRRFVVKPARLGGIAATQAIARQCAMAGIELVLTSVVDSAVGVTAAAHLSAALRPDLAHGLGTSAWLAQDVASPPTIVAGRLQLPEVPGLGILPCLDRNSALAK